MANRARIAPNRGIIHPFDLKFGTDTSGYLGPEQVEAGNRAAASDSANNGYSAVAPSVFREACRRWRATLPPSASRLEAYTFVDVGAGKGRALLLAAELPFRRVIGVEIDQALAAIARHNVAAWSRTAHPRSPIRIRRQDAMEFQWPRSPLLVYLNNPFDCAQVGQMAESLAAAPGPGRIDLLYVNPGCADTLANSGSFRVLWQEPIEMSEADQRADPYGAASDRVAAFRLSRAA